MHSLEEYRSSKKHKLSGQLFPSSPVASFTKIQQSILLSILAHTQTERDRQTDRGARSPRKTFFFTSY